MGKRFVQIAPSGEFIGEVDVSPRLAIACQLGGADGRTLFPFRRLFIVARV